MAKSRFGFPKAADERHKTFLDFGYKVLLLVGGAMVLYWLTTRYDELSVPWGGGAVTAKRTPKNPGAPCEAGCDKLTPLCNI